jgi:DNA-binding HxlR family transcriptional regulator
MATKAPDSLMTMTPEDCPVRATVAVIGGKWKPLILHYLKHKTMRFNEFRRVLPGAKHKVLSQQLRDLERAGIVTRKVYPEVPPRVEYSLSANGQSLRPVLAVMAAWGTKYQEQRAILPKGTPTLVQRQSTTKQQSRGAEATHRARRTQR